MLIKEITPYVSTNLPLSAVLSLTYTVPGSPLDIFRGVYEDMARKPVSETANRYEEVFEEFVKIADERKLFQVKPNIKNPYWSPSLIYEPKNVFGLLIQFIDQHSADIPPSLIPPLEDVEKFTNMVRRANNAVTLPEQFAYLLDITDNNIIGCAHLGMFATRLMARGADTRPYGITISSENLYEWNEKVAQFETYDSQSGNDGPGDTYYFWTYFFASLYFGQLSALSGKLNNFLFENGTTIMKFVKDKIAHKPIITSHHEASMIGRETGKGMLFLINEFPYQT